MNSAEKVRVLGIDPGLNITGYGVVDFFDNRPVVVEAGVVRSKRSKDLTERLCSIHEGIIDVLETFKPDVVGLEELYSHYERPQTAIIMGHARGAICLAVGQYKLPLKSYLPTQVKKVLTGNGRASKAQVQFAVERQLQLAAPPEPPDVADALAIAVCHCFLSLTNNLTGLS